MDLRTLLGMIYAHEAPPDLSVLAQAMAHTPTPGKSRIPGPPGRSGDGHYRRMQRRRARLIKALGPYA